MLLPDPHPHPSPPFTSTTPPCRSDRTLSRPLSTPQAHPSRRSRSLNSQTFPAYRNGRPLQRCPYCKQCVSTLVPFFLRSGDGDVRIGNALTLRKAPTTHHHPQSPFPHATRPHLDAAPVVCHFSLHIINQRQSQVPLQLLAPRRSSHERHNPRDTLAHGISL